MTKHYVYVADGDLNGIAKEVKKRGLKIIASVNDRLLFTNEDRTKFFRSKLADYPTDPLVYLFDPSKMDDVISVKKTLIDVSDQAYSLMQGLITPHDELLISMHRHDFVASYEGEFFLDGGNDYVRTNCPNCELVKVDIMKSRIIHDDGSEDEYEPVTVKTLPRRN
jgi:hypothetical protein